MIDNSNKTSLVPVILNHKIYRCASCGTGTVTMKGYGDGTKGWGHVVNYSCTKPAVSMEDWKDYLKVEKELKQQNSTSNGQKESSDA